MKNIDVFKIETALRKLSEKNLKMPVSVGVMLSRLKRDVESEVAIIRENLKEFGKYEMEAMKLREEYNGKKIDDDFIRKASALNEQYKDDIQSANDFLGKEYSGIAFTKIQADRLKLADGNPIELDMDIIEGLEPVLEM